MEASVTVTVVEELAPSAVAIIVTEPLVLPMIVVEKVPPASVVPVADPKATLPVPDCDRVTVWPGTTLLPASFAVTVNVVEPLVEIEDDPVVTETVEPIIFISIVLVADPAVAVIVAVRFVLLLPDVKVTLPGVVTVGALRTPVLVPIVTSTPDNEAFKAFNALIVIVEVEVPSVLIDVGEAERSIEEAVTPEAVPVLVMIIALVEPVMLACTIS